MNIAGGERLEVLVELVVEGLVDVLLHHVVFDILVLADGVEYLRR